VRGAARAHQAKGRPYRDRLRGRGRGHCQNSATQRDLPAKDGLIAAHRGSTRRATQRIDEEVGEKRACAATVIELGVVDRDLQTHRAPGVERVPEDRAQLLGAEAVRHAVVHRGHDRIIEAVGIDVNPEAVELGASDVCDGFARRSSDA